MKEEYDRIKEKERANGTCSLIGYVGGAAIECEQLFVWLSFKYPQHGFIELQSTDSVHLIHCFVFTS